MGTWVHVIDVFVIIHSILVYGKKWTGIFFVLACSLGLLSEHVGAAYGWVFGKFHYQPDRIMFFGTVPVLTPVSWWLILYCAYNTTNLVFGDMKDSRTWGVWLRAAAIVLMASLDGLMAMNLDMLFDPVMVSPRRARWVWEHGGAYFNIPIQNFLGWFLVAFSVSLLIRTFDAVRGRAVPLGERLLHYFPSGLYFCMFAFFGFLGYVDGYPHYTLIGFSGMIPFVLWAALRGVVMYARAAPGTPLSRRGKLLR